MPLDDTGVQLIEAMNSKRRSPRTQRPSSPGNPISPASSSKGGASPKAARTLDTELAAEPINLETAPEMTKSRRIQGYEEDWQRWNSLSEQLGYESQEQADLFHQVLLWAESQLMQEDTMKPVLENAMQSSPDTLSGQSMDMVPQLMSALTSLTVQFQEQQQLQLQLTQALTQMAQAWTSMGSNLAAGVGPKSGNYAGKAIAKEHFGGLNSKDLKKSHAKGSAEEKLRRAFQGIVDHNEASGRSSAEKWAINQNALAELTGCNRPAIKQFLKQYDSEIEAHHQQHQLLPRHNYAHGKVGIKITDIIHW
jgi:hypothetical protein